MEAREGIPKKCHDSIVGVSFKLSIHQKGEYISSSREYSVVTPLTTMSNMCMHNWSRVQNNEIMIAPLVPAKKKCDPNASSHCLFITRLLDLLVHNKFLNVRAWFLSVSHGFFVNMMLFSVT
jgi:hypothetical protein